MNYAILLKTVVDANGNTNEEGDCVPFCESEANAIVKCLTKINNHIGDMKFKVQKPIIKFMAF
jgi:hypothetical protein